MRFLTPWDFWPLSFWPLRFLIPEIFDPWDFLPWNLNTWIKNNYLIIWIIKIKLKSFFLFRFRYNGMKIDLVDDVREGSVETRKKSDATLNVNSFFCRSWWDKQKSIWGWSSKITPLGYRGHQRVIHSLKKY